MMRSIDNPLKKLPHTLSVVLGLLLFCLRGCSTMLAAVSPVVQVTWRGALVSRI